MKKAIQFLILNAFLLIIYSCTEGPKTVNNPPPCDSKIWYEDIDGDGLGNPDAFQESCEQPNQYSVLNGNDFIDEAVQERVYSILVKFTGENCSECGAWGWSAWEELHSNFIANGFRWSNYGNSESTNHFKSEELNPTMDTFETVFFTGSKPSFMANGKNFNQSTSAAELEAANFTNSTPKLAAVMSSKIEENHLTIKTEIKCFKDISGDYYVGAYLIEDKPIAYQAGHQDGDNTAHQLVMRGSLSASAWGEKFSSNPKTNDIFQKEFKTSIPDNFNRENLSYGVIIWRKNLNKYEYINTASTQGY